MPPIQDHPERYRLANELHARPFPVAEAPGRAVYLALKKVENAVARDRAADRAHLVDLLDRHGAPHPQPDATHYAGRIGKHMLKWESHTEFVTYTVFQSGETDRPFDPAHFAVFPEDWLATAPAERLTSAILHIERAAGDAGLAERADDWMVAEGLAMSRVLDDQLVIAADFHIDPGGHMRFAVFARPGTGERRIGRVVQRLCEIETYKAAAMLGLFRVRALGPELGQVDARLSALMADMAGRERAPEAMLDDLLATSARLESLIAEASFRLSATAAYEAIVNQRVEVLRETRFAGRQTLREFMTRRFDPAMRTVAATRARMEQLSGRAARASDLLRTRVDVDRTASSQALLESMDRRAALQLRLQHTVEGLSVVAISYYAVGLALYMLGPLGAAVGVEKGLMAALVAPAVILAVWWGLRRIRAGL